MLTKKTTLVLGAGASHPYGYPLGSTLRLNILNIETALIDRAGLKAHGNVEEFLQAFRRSRLHSIDSFLAARLEMAGVGKATIAAILLSYEQAMSGKITADAQDWYDYLWNRLASGHSWDELSFENLSIVTFNYDRSLEFFLLNAMTGTYGKSLEEAADKLKGLKINHVYGDIGEHSPLLPPYDYYGSPVTFDRVTRATERLKVIPEARNNDPSFEQAQATLKYSETICFLGFGFDRVNLQRLDSKKTCSLSRPGPGGEAKPREVVASCLGLFDSEIRLAASECSIYHLDIRPRIFVSRDCLTTLRESLILG